MSEPEKPQQSALCHLSDDAAYLEALWREAFTPPDRQPVWKWAEEHIEAIPYSPIPGPFKTSNSPMLAEVMQEMVNPRTRLVSIIAAVQSSKSTAIEVAICYIIANLPGPALWLDQNDDDAKDQAEGRLRKMFDFCRPVKALYPSDRYKLRTTTLNFANGMTLWVAGAYNKSNLQRRSIRWLIGDETWRWPQGHMAEAEARTTAFGWLGKCIFCSQGGFEGDDTHTKFSTTDRREWMYLCPHCGHRQPFTWSCIEWDKECKDKDGHYDFRKVRASTYMRCSNCQARFEDRDDVRRDANACFVPQNPNAASEYVGFHWNALSTMSWGMLAELYLRAKIAAKKGDYTQLQQFWQKRLALPWDEYQEDYHIETTPSDYRMGEPWEQEGNINGVPLRILTVDVQRDSFYLVVRSWSLDGSSRMLFCDHILSWDDIIQVQKRFGVHSNLCFIDCGYSTFEVYSHCAENGWTALMGDKRSTFTHHRRNGKSVERFYSPKRQVNLGYAKEGVKGCDMFFWSNLNVKDALCRLRRNDEAPTWEVPNNAPQDYLDMLDSEYRTMDHGRWIWKQIGTRPNHYLDCEAMSVCAAIMLKLVGSESVPEEKKE